MFHVKYPHVPSERDPPVPAMCADSPCVLETTDTPIIKFLKPLNIGVFPPDASTALFP